MEPLSPGLFADLSLLPLAISAAAGVIAAAAYYRRQRTSPLAAAEPPAEPTGIIYNDAPTVRVVDSQRVDRLRKVVRLRTGDHIDVLETRTGTAPRFRVTLKAIDLREEPLAHLIVEFGGTEVSCGPLVEEVARNEFLLPRAMRDEPRSSVFHYQESGDALDFMRLKMRAINPQAGTAELDIMQVCGRWPVADTQ
jgi:hypothetical protein